MDAADAAETGTSGYRGPWASLQRVDLCDNRLDSPGGLEVLLALPSISEVGVRGNPGFMGRHNAEGARAAAGARRLLCADRRCCARRYCGAPPGV